MEDDSCFIVNDTHYIQNSRRAPSYLVTRLCLPHAIVVRLHVCKSKVVILTPEKSCTVDV